MLGFSASKCMVLACTVFVLLAASKVPTSPPQNVTAVAESSNSINVTWQSDNTENITGFFIIYKIWGSEGLYRFKMVNKTQKVHQSAKISDLKPFSDYRIIIKAFNNNGAGPASQPAIVRTLELEIEDQTSGPSNMDKFPYRYHVVAISILSNIVILLVVMITFYVVSKKQSAQRVTNDPRNRINTENIERLIILERGYSSNNIPKPHSSRDAADYRARRMLPPVENSLNLNVFLRRYRRNPKINRRFSKLIGKRGRTYKSYIRCWSRHHDLGMQIKANIKELHHDAQHKTTKISMEPRLCTIPEEEEDCTVDDDENDSRMSETSEKLNG